MVRVRYECLIDLECERDMPLVTLLDTHPTRLSNLISSDAISATARYDGRALDTTLIHKDRYGNLLRRLSVPAGGVVIKASGLYLSPPEPDLPAGHVPSLMDVPSEEAVRFLSSSRYCDTQRLSDLALALFGGIEGSGERAMAVMNWVAESLQHDTIFERPSRTASEALQEQLGTSRDFAHLAAAMLRCLNLPTRYCMGFVARNGHGEQGFGAWVEAFIAHRWRTLDACPLQAGQPRILIAAGRDAADVPPLTSFGRYRINRMDVTCRVEAVARTKQRVKQPVQRKKAVRRKAA